MNKNYGGSSFGISLALEVTKHAKATYDSDSGALCSLKMKTG